MNDYDKIKALDNADGKCFFECVVGYNGEVHRIWNALVLFEVPMYGGKPQYIGTYQFSDDGINEILSIIKSWY